MKLRAIGRNGARVCLTTAGLLLASGAGAQAPTEAPPRAEENPGAAPVTPHQDSSSAGKVRLQEGGDAPPPKGSATPDSAPAEADAPRDPSWKIEDEKADAPSEASPPEEVAQGDEAAEAAEPKKEKEEPKRFVLPPPSEPLVEAPPNYNEVPFTHHQLRWEFQAGLRTSWIGTGAFDPFAENDGLLQFSLSFGRGVFRSGPWSVAVLGVWEIGGTSAKIRSEEASYSLQRLALAVEGRYHLRHWVYGYGRVAPGALQNTARVEAFSQAFAYESSAWLVNADAALGAAARLAGNPDGREQGARLWAFLEGGYGWSSAHDLSLSPTSGAPERSQPRDLGELTLAGPYGRAGLILSF